MHFCVCICKYIHTYMYAYIHSLSPNFPSAEPIIVKSLDVLEDVVLGIESEGSKSKNVMYHSLKKFVELSIPLFQHCLGNARECTARLFVHS